MFDKAFEKLKKMNGCLALELTDNTGEPLYFFENKKDIKVKEISKELNHVLQGIHESSAKYSLGSVSSIQVSSNKYSMFLTCTGEMQRIHMHVFVLFDLNTNIALAKLAIDNALEEALSIING